MTQLFLGIDIGTSATKALLMDAAGVVRAVATSEYQFQTPRPGWAEQDPREWWIAAINAIRTALQQAAAPGSAVAAIGLTGQMHGLVLLDAPGAPVRPCIMWNDHRAAQEGDEIHRRIGRERIIAITGKPALPNFTAPKLLWMRAHEPDLYRRGATMLLPKDYVRLQMSGVRCTDVADGSGTSFLDIKRRTWSDEIAATLEVSRAWLPEAFESPVICARVTRDAAMATGLLEGTPIVAGAGDQAAEAIGVGAIQDGQVSIAVGTSGVVFVSCDQARIDPTGRLHAYCHAIPGCWHMMGVMLSAGGSLRWYRDVLGDPERAIAAQRGIDPYDVLLEHAAHAPAGCDGLLFLPYLSGERTPHADPHARGAFVGLTLRHSKVHFSRAVIEGITFGLRDCLELVRGLGIAAKSLRVSGGGSRSPFWRQIMADVFDAEIVTVSTTEGAALGAAILAAVGAGAFASVDDARARLVREVERTSPGENAAIYPAYTERYRSLYGALKAEFAAIAHTITD